MNADSRAPLVQSVLHPTDFSPASHAAFAHALAIALLRQTSLTILNVHPEAAGVPWSEFPAIRDTLERWRILEPGSSQSAVFDELSVRVRKVALEGRPLPTLLQHLDDNGTDLIVLATEGREGLPRFIRPSLAEDVARKSRTMSLFVPAGSPGFVALADGHLSLRRILVAVDRSPLPRAAIAVATRAAAALGDSDTLITVLHVGSTPVPFDLPEDPGGTWDHALRQGDPVEEILAEAEEREADLIVMTTQGHHGVLDALRGSTTEQVLRRASCPLLAVPAD